MTKYICVDCGVIILPNKAMGSMKRPYCVVCFNRRFSCWEEYLNHVRQTHG